MKEEKEEFAGGYRNLKRERRRPFARASGFRGRSRRGPGRSCPPPDAECNRCNRCNNWNHGKRGRQRARQGGV